MSFIKNKLWYLKAKLNLKSEKGQAMVEYGLLIGLIAVFCIAALVILGPSIAKMFKDANTAIEAIPAP